jgi:carbon monoxide dehydrogenase subunit G
VELTNEFRVGVPVEQAWSVLTDVERIAPCLPGAELQEIEGDEYRGVVKVKVGPITAQYKGKATFQEKDDENHRAVLRAEGRDTRGAGNANATITATLVADGDGTKVSVVTDLAITGKVAQFGRGVLADVSGKLLTQFVTCLESTVLADQQPQAAATAASGDGQASDGQTAASPPPPRPPVEPVDLLDVAGGSMAKRFAPLAGALFAIWLFIRRRKRRRRRQG